MDDADQIASKVIGDDEPLTALKDVSGVWCWTTNVDGAFLRPVWLMAAHDPIAVVRKMSIAAQMPFYRFMIHGRDPRHPDDVRGFFTTRHAYAVTKEKAAEKVLSRLTKEFTSDVSASIWASEAPNMIIEDGWRIGIHQIRSAPNKGSTFYEP